jgi:hypothetical protein
MKNKKVQHGLSNLNPQGKQKSEIEESKESQ